MAIVQLYFLPFQSQPHRAPVSQHVQEDRASSGLTGDPSANIVRTCSVGNNLINMLPKKKTTTHDVPRECRSNTAPASRCCSWPSGLRWWGGLVDVRALVHVFSSSLHHSWLAHVQRNIKKTHCRGKGRGAFPRDKFWPLPWPCISTATSVIGV